MEWDGCEDEKNGLLMHVKCIHELFTLLKHIPTYFATHMMLFSCFILIYGDLSMIHFIWVITLQERKTMFCVFSLSETYTESN
jgi:hypothetical protein